MHYILKANEDLQLSMSKFIHSTILKSECMYIYIYIYSVHNNLKGGFIPEKFKRSMEAFDVSLLKSANNLKKDD